MKNPSELILKNFLDRCTPEKRKALEKFLSGDERLRIEKLPSFEGEASPDKFGNGALIEKVHWSWFLPTLKTYPEEEQKLFLAALDAKTAKSLAKELNLLVRPKGINEIARSYMRQILLNSLLARTTGSSLLIFYPRPPSNRFSTSRKKN